MSPPAFRKDDERRRVREEYARKQIEIRRELERKADEDRRRAEEKGEGK